MTVLCTQTVIASAAHAKWSRCNRNSRRGVFHGVAFRGSRSFTGSKESIQEQYRGSSSRSPALLRLARAGGKEQAAVTGYEHLQKPLRAVPLPRGGQACSSSSLRGSGAAADGKNCARTKEPSKNRAFQKF